MPSDLGIRIRQNFAFLTADSGNTRDQTSTVYEAQIPRGYLGWGNVSTLGFSLAGAIGAKLAYPEKMLAPDKPFVMPDKEPITLKIGDKLSLKCVPIPPGKFLMGTPVYMWPYFVEEYPHIVTLTKLYYMAEIPITQEMYEAVMGSNPSIVKDPQIPVQNLTDNLSWTKHDHNMDFGTNIRFIDDQRSSNAGSFPDALMNQGWLTRSSTIANSGGNRPNAGLRMRVGLTSAQILDLVRTLKGINLAGCDLVEVSPPYDSSEITSLLAANLLYEMLCLF